MHAGTEQARTRRQKGGVWPHSRRGEIDLLRRLHDV